MEVWRCFGSALQECTLISLVRSSQLPATLENASLYCRLEGIFSFYTVIFLSWDCLIFNRSYFSFDFIKLNHPHSCRWRMWKHHKSLIVQKKPINIKMHILKTLRCIKGFVEDICSMVQVCCSSCSQALSCGLSLVLPLALPWLLPSLPLALQLPASPLWEEGDITAERFVSVITSRQRCSVYYRSNEAHTHLEEMEKNFINCCHGNFSICRLEIVAEPFLFPRESIF